jgi:alkaline phosphatase D
MAMPGVCRCLIVLAAQLHCVSPSHSEVLPLPEPDQLITRIAFGSCAFQSVEQPIFRALVASQPDLYLSLGDAIYGDYDPKTKSVYQATPGTLRREWQVLADNPDWQALVAHVPVMAIWDNHDYGHHSAGADFSLKSESGEIFLDFFGEPQDSARRRRPGIYDARVFGPKGRRVQVILLDTRSFKSLPLLAPRPEGAKGSLGKYAPNLDPQTTLLGATQWQWLEEQLRKEAELRLVVSSGQLVADQKGMDEWGNYPLERQRFFDVIERTGAADVLILSGNAHFSEVSLTNEGPYPLVDFTSSGLTHVNRDYPKADNRYRVAGPFVELSFGLLEIDWEASGGESVTLSAVGLEGQKAFEYRLNKLSD